MSVAEFESVADAFARRAETPQPSMPDVERVTVLGGGAEARLLACLCLAAGAEVTQFSAYGHEIAAIRTAGGTTLRGAGPIGTFAVDQADGPAIRLTAELDSAVRDAQLIFVTGPVLKQRTYAMVLAEHLTDGQVLVLVPGRSLGALEVAWYLRIGGCQAEVVLVEVQILPYWTRADGSTLHLTRPPAAAAGVLPSHRADALHAVQRFLPNITPMPSVVTSGFWDGSGLVEAPALLLGQAATDESEPLPDGATPLPERNTFRSLIGDRQRSTIAAMAEERQRVADCWGVRDLPTAAAWMDTYAGAPAGDDARPAPDAADAQRLVRDAIIGSLSPLMSAAAVAAVDVPVTRAVATIAETVLGGNLANAGRRLETIGIGAAHLSDARRAMDAVARAT